MLNIEHAVLFLLVHSMSFFFDRFLSSAFILRNEILNLVLLLVSVSLHPEALVL